MINFNEPIMVEKAFDYVRRSNQQQKIKWRWRIYEKMQLLAGKMEWCTKGFINNFLHTCNGDGSNFSRYKTWR